jgi:hypothetical protein
MKIGIDFGDLREVGSTVSLIISIFCELSKTV